MQVIRQRAGFAVSYIPLPPVLRITQRPAFFKIATAIVVCVKKLTIAAVRKDHDERLIHASNVITTAGVHSDDIACVNKSRNLYH